MGNLFWNKNRREISYRMNPLGMDYFRYADDDSETFSQKRYLEIVYK